MQNKNQQDLFVQELKGMYLSRVSLSCHPNRLYLSSPLYSVLIVMGPTFHHSVLNPKVDLSLRLSSCLPACGHCRLGHGHESRARSVMVLGAVSGSPPRGQNRRSGGWSRARARAGRTDGRDWCRRFPMRVPLSGRARSHSHGALDNLGDSDIHDGTRSSFLAGSIHRRIAGPAALHGDDSDRLSDRGCQSHGGRRLG